MRITLRETAEKLKSAEKILLTAHINPDGDAIGSTLAMLQILRAIGKNVSAYIDDKIPKNFLTMPCVEEIKRPAEGEKISADLLVVLDTSIDRTGKVIDITDAPILNIDHHVTNKGENIYLYDEPTAAATCEIIFKLCEELGANITKEIAICLYSGLATDTGFFNYSNTKPATFRAAASLVECGVQPNLIAEKFEERTFRELKVMSAALQTTKLFFGGKVVGMFIDEELFKQTDTTEGFIDLIRVIDSVDVAFVLTCREKNLCRVSMRSKTVNVAEIANKLGGGGHIRAAGCTIQKNFSEAKNILVHAIGQYMIETKKLTSKEFLLNQEIALADFEI